MKNKRLILSIGIFVLISVMTLVFTSNSNQTVELTENQKLFNELKESHFGEFGSDKYLIKDGYISKIYPNTKIKDFVKELHEDVVIYENEKQVTDGVVKTGMVLKFHDLTFTLLVTGDLNNDGKYNQIDLNRIIRFIGKEDITDVEKVLSDLTGDGFVTEADADLGAEILVGSKKLEITKPDAVVIPNNSLTGSSLGEGWYSSNVILTLASYSNTYKYEYYGSKEAKSKLRTALLKNTFAEGAYLVRVFYYAADGNTKIITYLIGVDYSRNKCIEQGINTLSECMLINDGNYLRVEEAKENIKKKTADFSKISTTDEGLLSAVDTDGDSFYYRGAVEDNYVDFAGYSWRIVRRNGDGSVRLVYNGTSTSSTGASATIGDTAFRDAEVTGLRYSGYKYSENLEYVDLGIQKVNIYTIGTFADNYTCQEMSCSLSGNIYNRSSYEIIDIIMNGNSTNNYHPYKYFLYNGSGIVEFVEPVYENGNISEDYIMAKVYGYIKQKKPYETSSKVKKYVDSWYESNLLNKTDSSGNKWSDYLVDNYFCDDKSFASLDSTLLNYFGSYDRLSNKTSPSLICPSEDDNYNVKGGELKYPIAMLTADEVAFAGGKSNAINPNFWLNIGVEYFTMSTVNSGNGAPYMYTVNNQGNLTSTGYAFAGDSFKEYVRPVINLSKDVLFVAGDGSASDPYQVALTK